MDQTGHTVKAYDKELNRLSNVIAQMGGLAESQIASAIEAVVKRDADLAARTVEADAKIDELEREVDEFVVRLLALRQPMASDLREIVSALKIAADLERAADHAKSVAKRAIALAQVPPVKPAYTIPRMGKMVQRMITDVLDAYVERDADKALVVWRADEEVDESYNSLFRELLTYMMEDPRNISTCAHLLFVAKNIERMGDLATNIAETIHYVVHGVALPQDRPKSDITSLTVVQPDVDDTTG
ncbi:MAG: phosphate signaling complex protein PhoU [Minwuiales bacterium]|nr:phosphate signaling complex protein PhoU [Minwuiales bacterium]